MVLEQLGYHGCIPYKVCNHGYIVFPSHSEAAICCVVWCFLLLRYQVWLQEPMGYTGNITWDRMRCDARNFKHISWYVHFDSVLWVKINNLYHHTISESHLPWITIVWRRKSKQLMSSNRFGHWIELAFKISCIMVLLIHDARQPNCRGWSEVRFQHMVFLCFDL